MNEKEYKERAAKVRGAICSVTGSPCECFAGGGCAGYENLLDRAPAEVVRWAKAALLRLEGAHDYLTEAQNVARGVSRRYPLPEVRDWSRRIDQLLDEMEEALNS
jgi:hypothetical protein